MRTINNDWTDFVLHNDFSNYDVYFMVDENPKQPAENGDIFIEYLYKKNSKENSEEKHTKNTDIQIIQIRDTLCKQNNYYNSSVASNLKEIVAWDKALFYFGHIIVGKYDNIWFLEDDVFLSSPELLLRMDHQHTECDLLCSFHEINNDGKLWGNGVWNHWVNVEGKISLPWSHSLISVCRMSQRLLGRIDEYVNNRPLMFIESLFTTLSLHNNYCIVTPDELSTITYDHHWDENEIINPHKIYHPVKNTSIHSFLRKKNFLLSKK